MNYAYKDTGRTKIIYADSSDIIKYKGVRCYCKNPSCNAKMFIHNPEHPNFAYFQASGKPSHNGSCGSIYNHFDNSKYDEKLFSFPEVLMNLESKPSGTKPTGKSSPKKGKSTSGGEKALKTIKEIYKMATNTPPNDSYNGVKIKNILADVRSYSDYKDGIDGYHLVECNFYCFDKKEKTIIMNFPFLPNNKYYLCLCFKDEDLFKKEYSRFYDTGHTGIIVISGLWEKKDEEYRTKTIKAECTIKSEKQIAIIKKK